MVVCRLLRCWGLRLRLGRVACFLFWLAFSVLLVGWFGFAWILALLVWLFDFVVCFGFCRVLYFAEVCCCVWCFVVKVVVVDCDLAGVIYCEDLIAK